MLTRVGVAGLLGIAFAFGMSARTASAAPLPTQYLTDQDGVDLSKMPWRYVQEVSPGSPDERKRSFIRLPLAKPLALTGDSTWLICEISVASYDTPASLYYGSEVMIGHIDGNDKTYWNNILIGETTGRQLSETGRFRRYKVPPEAIRLGKVNQLRIHLTGFGGSNTINSLQEPLTVAPLSAAPADWQLQAYQDQLGKLTRQVYRMGRYRPDFLPFLEFMTQLEDIWIEIDQAQGLIEQGEYQLLQESFAEIESELATLQQLSQPVKRQLARIERQKYELDMVRIAAQEGVQVGQFAELERQGWRPPRARPQSFGRWGWFFRDGLPTLKEVTPSFIEEPDGRRIALLFNRVLDVQVVDLNWVSKTYLVRAELELQGRKEVATFEIVTSIFYPGMLILPKFEPYGEILRVETIQKFFDMRTKYFTQLEARPPGEGGNVFLGWDGREQDRPTMLRFTPSHFDPMGLHITACFPGGLRQMDTRSWSLPEKTPKDLRQFPVAEYLSRNFPWQCREYYRYDEGSNRIQIYNVFEYYYQPKDNQYLVIAPPVLTFAKANGYPVEIKSKLLHLGIDTFYGPLQGGYAPGGILSYSLPVPSLEERALPRVEGPQPWQTLLDGSVGGWEKARATNGVDALYKGVTAAYNAWFQLDPKIRQQIAREAWVSMEAGLQDNCWPQYVEPFSELEVSWTYALEGPYYDGYDQEWGNGLSLYGLCKYCQYSGNWRFLPHQWETVDKLWSWFIRTDDWAWMRCSNARHGHGTGAGDCSLAAFSGAWAYAKMADQLNRRANAEEGLYVLARSSVPLVARFFYSQWAQEQKRIEPEEVVLGFHEGEGFLRGRMDRYPWEVTSLISGNGIHPEALSFLLEHAKPQLEQYVETFEKFYPDWADGEHAYPFETLYEGNSGYITMPHLYLRSRLGWPPERLGKALERAQPNRAMWWVAPPALAELIAGRAGVVLTRWEPAILKEAKLEGSELSVELESTVRRPIELGLRAEREPTGCWVNNEPHSSWTYDLQRRELLVQKLRQQRLTVRIQWDPASTSGGDQP